MSGAPAAGSGRSRYPSTDVRARSRWPARPRTESSARALGPSNRSFKAGSASMGEVASGASQNRARMSVTAGTLLRRLPHGRAGRAGRGLRRRPASAQALLVDAALPVRRVVPVLLGRLLAVAAHLRLLLFGLVLHARLRA